MLVPDDSSILDRKTTLLIAAGSAMAANCASCLEKIVPDLVEAGVNPASIRKAIEIGQFVKDRSAAFMKGAVDALTGTVLAVDAASCACPSDGPRPRAGARG